MGTREGECGEKKAGLRGKRPLPKGLLATGAPLLSLPLPTTLSTILTCSPTPHCPLFRDQEAAPQDIPAPHRGLQFPLQCPLVVSARSGVSLRPPFWSGDSLLVVNCLPLTDSLSSCSSAVLSPVDFSTPGHCQGPHTLCGSDTPRKGSKTLRVEDDLLGIAEAGTDLELGHQLGWPDTPLHIDGRLRENSGRVASSRATHRALWVWDA